MPLNVIGLYRQASEKTEPNASVPADGNPVRINNLEMFPESQWASANEALPQSGVRVAFGVDTAPGKYLFLVRVTSPDGLPYFTTYSDRSEFLRPGRVKIEATIPRLMLNPGEYRLWVAVCAEAGEHQMLANDSLPLKVVSPRGIEASFNLMWNEASWRVSKPK